MKTVFTLIRPRLLSVKRQGSQLAPRRFFRIFFLSLLGSLFWAGTFALFYRILNYFKSIEIFGDILASKLLSMAIMTFFALLIFSSVITSLAKLYLSRDLTFVHSLPIPRDELFLARFLESTLDSSWMVILYSLPVFFSYGIVYGAPFFFYAMIFPLLFTLCLIASALSNLLVLTVALFLPAGKLRTIFVFLGLLLFIILLVIFRLTKPEQLVNPEAFQSLILYFQTLTFPSSPFLPTTWITEALKAALYHRYLPALFQFALSLSLSISLIYLALVLSNYFYFLGFSKAQTAAKRFFSRALRPSPSVRKRKQVIALIDKEWKTFFRDHTQWSQLFLLAALILIYIYNFSVLPAARSPQETIFLKNVLAFLNLGLASFVLTAISARFAFPAISIEKEAIWIIRAAPLSIRKFILTKFFFYLIPLLILSEFLIITTNTLLKVDLFVMVLSIFTIFLMTPGIVALAIGLGAAYPDFQAENPAQSATSFGGLLYMLLSACFIGLVIVLEAGPVYRWTIAGLKKGNLAPVEWLWLFTSLLGILILCLMATVLPLRYGINNLTRTLS